MQTCGVVDVATVGVLGYESSCCGRSISIQAKFTTIAVNLKRIPKIISSSN